MKPTHVRHKSGTDALLKSMLYALRAEDSAGVKHGAGAGRGVVPFITISRQAGAGGKTLARRIVERLSEIDPADPDGSRPPWACWDHELVEKVSSEHHIAEALVEALEDSRRHWV